MIIKKIATTLWLVIFGIVLSIFLELIVNKDTSRETLNEYLLALKNSDTNKALLLSTDDRFSDKEEQRNFLEDAFENKDDNIKSFKVLDRLEKSKDDSVILAQVQFKNGEVIKRGFEVKKDQYEGYRVIISGEAANKNPRDIIKNGGSFSIGDVEFGKDKL